MGDSETDIETTLRALDDQHRTLFQELSEISDEERKEDIAETLATIEEQKRHLEERREELRRARAEGAG